MAGLTWKDVDINHIDLCDKAVYEKVYKQGNTCGIFQMESAEARKMCMEAKCDNAEDIIVVNAANRPGTKDSFPDYCKNKLHPELTEVLHPSLIDLFKQSHSVLLYQEQALSMFRYAGFPETEVDNARRCVKWDTKVMMSDGNEKNINEIHIGDEVVSFGEDGFVGTNKVSNVFDNGVQKTYTIKAQNGIEICGTKDHKLMTQSGWKRIENIDESDYVFVPKRVIPCKSKKASKEYPSESTLYMTGLLLGDGYLKPKDSKSITFTNSERVLIDKYVECVNLISKSKSPCKFNIAEQDGVTCEKVYTAHMESPQYKQAMSIFCDKYDLKKLAAEKAIPSDFMQLPMGGKLTSLIAGLFNTDGGYNLNAGRIEYYTTSKVLSYQIKNLLLRYRIYSYVSQKKVKGYDGCTAYTVMIQQPYAVNRFCEVIAPRIVGRKQQDYYSILNASRCKNPNYNYLLPAEYAREILLGFDKCGYAYKDFGNLLGNYQEGGFKLSESAITDTKAREILKYSYAPHTHQLLTSDYIPVRVISKSESGYEHVYDIEVENDHTYIANGVVSHNCIGKKQKEKMQELKGQFEEGLKSRNWSKNQIDSIWELMVKQSSYCFNRGHKVSVPLRSDAVSKIF